MKIYCSCLWTPLLLASITVNLVVAQQTSGPAGTFRAAKRDC